MADEEKYDAIIIGDGQAGGPLSTALVKAGYRTAVIEREHAGGTCVNEGCTPTKTMVASARVAYLVGRAREYGVAATSPRVTMSVVRKRKQDIVDMFRDGSQKAIESGGVDFLMGEGSFTGPHSVEVKLHSGETRQLTARMIVVDTGTRPSEPPIEGLSDVHSLNSTTIMELDEVPDHLMILGGGYIGVEFAQMFRRFGSNVTIVERMPHLLGREDHDVADAVCGILRDDGIEVLLSTSVQRVGAGDDGAIRVTIGGDGDETALTGSHLLVAVGRKPNTQVLNLDAAGVQHDERGFIQVNERLETNVPGIYATGEVAGTPAFTHMSYDDFRIIRSNVIEGGNRTTRDRLTPYTVFLDPQLGRVGLTEQEARDRRLNIRVATMPMNHVARALEMDESRGMVKAIVDMDSKQIVGCAVLGIEGGEVMAMIEIAMMGKLPYTALRDGIFAHPTLAELLNNLFGQIDG
ncbi:MAG: mercuric reductase [Chloroflexota bacterium]